MLAVAAPTSLAPEPAAHVGIPFPDLCRIITEDASCNR
jgi:D-alanine-D-alanine ligase